jgi:hypothetical protein
MGRAEEQEFADPPTISRSAATLSDTCVARAGGRVQADPEPTILTSGLYNIQPSHP